MAFITIYDEIVFIEGDNLKAQRKEEVVANFTGFGAQMKNLNDVKSNLSSKAKSLGCNCILDFIYGQKTALFSLDDVKFYGQGVASILEEEEYKIIINKNNINN